jgi:shikimate 5-dehydrogenase
VYDLNYREDSQGCEWAALFGLKYFSGLEIFETQARLQQMIWSEQNVTSQLVW